jgi:probable H4MPT-linked C1 transfer pathway protein
MTWLALDVGGANLKAADGHGYAAIRPFALWRTPQRLSEELHALIAEAPYSRALAVTMTGELADCYESKAAGVEAILAAVEASAGERSIAVYLTDGRLATPAEARAQPMLAAASNWHALATYANRFVARWPALLVDIGSTTADIVPLAPSGPAADGVTDIERLLAGELVYTGVERSPVCAVIRTLPYRSADCPVASELFATAGDAYLLLEDLPERPDNRDTADGRARTRAAAHCRMARMVCADATQFTMSDALAAAAAVRDAQMASLQAALEKVTSRMNQPPQTFIGSGQGEFLWWRLAERLPWSRESISLASRLGPTPSRCAPAHALAVLARERGERDSG